MVADTLDKIRGTFRMSKCCGLLVFPQEREVTVSEFVDGFWLLLTVRAGPRGRLDQGAQGHSQTIFIYFCLQSHIQRAGQRRNGSPGAEGRPDMRNEPGPRTRHWTMWRPPPNLPTPFQDQFPVPAQDGSQQMVLSQSHPSRARNFLP